MGFRGQGIVFSNIHVRTCSSYYFIPDRAALPGRCIHQNILNFLRSDTRHNILIIVKNNEWFRFDFQKFVTYSLIFHKRKYVYKRILDWICSNKWRNLIVNIEKERILSILISKLCYLIPYFPKEDICDIFVLSCPQIFSPFRRLLFNLYNM